MMYNIQDAHSDAMAIYFVILIFLGPIFAVQLFLVVISTKFAETKESLKALEVSKIPELPPKAEEDEEADGDVSVHPMPIDELSSQGKLPGETSKEGDVLQGSDAEKKKKGKKKKKKTEKAEGGEDGGSGGEDSNEDDVEGEEE